MADLAARFVLPLKGPFDKGITAEVAGLESLFSELLSDDHLSGNAGMISAHLPECFITLHAFSTNYSVDQAVLKSMAHVECSRDVWRWNRN